MRVTSTLGCLIEGGKSNWGVWRNPKNLIHKEVEIKGGLQNDQKCYRMGSYIKQYNRCDSRDLVIDSFYLDAKVPLKLYRVEAYLKNKG